MKKLNLVFAIIFLPSIQSSAQVITFERTYGGTGFDRGFSVQQTSDGGYIITGFTDSFGAGSQDVYLIKTDASGDTLWTKTFGGTSVDWGLSVQQTSDDGYIITGRTISFGAGENDIYLVKTDAHGDTLWTKTFGGTKREWGFSVQQTSDGGYIITGRTESFGAGEWSVYLIKTDSIGDTLWTKAHGGIIHNEGLSVQQTVDSGYIISGWTDSFGAWGSYVYLIKTDFIGDTLWTKTYGVGSGTSVQQTDDGGYIITGGRSDVYLTKTDANGDALWTKTFGGTNNDYGYSVQQTSDGGYIIGGYTQNFGAVLNDVYLIKTDSNGDTLWTKTFGGTREDYCYSVQQTSDGGYIIGGTTKSFGVGNDNIYLIKTDSLGNVGKLGIEEEHTSHYPIRFWIAQNYPNPFNPITTISYKLPLAVFVNLSIYNVTGQLVKTLVSSHKSAGYHTVSWNASGGGSGLYFYRIKAGNYTETKKCVILK